MGSMNTAKYITDGDAVTEYLSNRDTASSALGMARVAAWNKASEAKDGEAEDTAQLRATWESIVQRANEPLVEPKDAWDLALDSGTAYPTKRKVSRDPFRHFDRKTQRNLFQTTQKGQSAGTQKKGGAHNLHRLNQRNRKRHLMAE